ncbi:Myosin type-2 heavy chain 1, partial [Spiromyces aspiralis]
FIDKLYHQFNREPPTTTWSKATIARNKLLELQQQSKPNPGKPDLSLVSSFFSKPRFSNEAFTIKHYACDVTYESEGFLEKNRDTVPDEIMELLRKSSFPLISELVDVSALDQQKPPGGPSAPSSSTTASSTSHTLTGTLTGSAPKFSRLASVRAMFEGNGDPATTSTTGTGGKPTAAELHSGTTGKAPGAHPRKQAPTLAMVFKHSLNQLMDTLAATDMHYIRCVKPNSAKEAWGFEPDLVLNQLRSCGVIETIRISKAGYPSRMPIRAFNERYEILIPEDERVLVRGQRQKDPPGPAEECAARAQRHQSVIIDGTAWTRFNTRKSVFTDQSEDGADAGVKSKDTVPRDAEDPVTSPSAPTSPEVSQDERDLCVQIVERTIKDKDKYQIGISKIFFRAGQWAVLEQLRTELLTKSVVVLQKYIRSYQARRKLEEYRKAVILIQEWYRRHRICKQILNLGRQRIAVRQIEHAWLGFAQRRRYLAARQAFIKMQAVTKGVLDRRVFNERRAKFEAERLRRIEEMKEEERRMLEVQKAAEEAERQEELEKAAIEEEKKKKEKEELEKIERRAIEAATPEMAADTTGSNTKERPVDTGGGSEYVQDTRTGQDSHNKDERARVAKAEAREIMASVVDALKRQAEANMSTVMPMPSHPEKLPSPVSMRTVAESPVKEPPPPPDDLPAQEITSDSGNSRTSREQSSRPKQRVVFAEGHMEYLHAMQVEEDERNRKKLVQQQRIQASQERRELERRAAEAEAELEELLKLKELRRNGSIEMLSSQRPLWEHDKTLAAGDQKFTPRKSNISASRLRQPSSGRSGILEETAPIPRSYTEGKIKLPSIVRFSMVEESSTALSRIPSPPSHVANRRRVMEEARQNLLRAGASPTRDEFGVPSSMDSRLMSGLVHGGDKNGLYRDRSQSDLARLSTSSLLAPKTSLTKQRPKDQGLDHGWDTRAPKRYSLRPPAQGDGSSPK